jgi:hypothetical protein
MYTKIPLTHNQNTYTPQSILKRMYCVPTTWTPPAAAGIRKSGTMTILNYYAPTPPAGQGDPRVMGKRIVNPTLRTEMYVG